MLWIPRILKCKNVSSTNFSHILSTFQKFRPRDFSQPEIFKRTFALAALFQIAIFDKIRKNNLFLDIFGTFNYLTSVNEMGMT